MDLIALHEVADGHPAHLEGVPSCLHKYESLLRDSWERREQTAARERLADAATG